MPPVWKMSPSLARPVLLLSLVCLVIAVGARDASAQTKLEDRIGRILSDRRYRKSSIGIHVVALDTGRVIYSCNATARFIPASNEKLVTAAAALQALGEHYEFRTAVYGAGTMDGALLRGDLILQGGGDPTLGGRREDEDALTIFQRWARVLKARGLRRVAGDIVADDTFFDRVYRHPHWSEEQAWKWYYPTTCALSVNDNCVIVTVKPGASPGDAAVVSTEPASAPVELLNACKTSAKRQSIWFSRKPGDDVITVGGLVQVGSSGYSGEVTVPNPPLYAAALLKQALHAEGVAVDGRPRLADGRDLAREAGATPLCVRRTALVPVLRDMIKQSHNHYAEQVFKTIGAEAAGRGSWESGAARAALMLRDFGLRDDEFSLDDGSGLSRQNRLTPRLLTTVLTRMHGSDHAGTFLSLLSIAGEDGTLEKRLTEPPYRGNVRAKTGYIGGVGALSGYATTRAGTDVAFSILVNDSPTAPGGYSMREILDAICRAIVDCAE